jgi:hypothetical protein
VRLVRKLLPADGADDLAHQVQGEQLELESI